MRAPKIRFAALLTGLALLGAGCRDQNLPQNSLDPQGPVARQLDDLITPVFYIAGVILVFVLALLAIAMVRFRRRSDDEIPRQVHGNARLEIAWTIIPALILTVVGVLTLGVLVDINERPGADALPVKVIGHQWWWEYQYPEQDLVTANELHIPVGRKVDLELTSVDVMHNFWPPKLSGKIYAIPGRINHMTIEAEEPGTYYGQCAEFCGLSHANMRLRVVAHSPEDFEEWVEANTGEAPLPSESDAAEFAGAQLFRQKGCGSCHTVEGFAAGRVGPDLTHLYQRKVFAGAMFELDDDDNMRRWLRNPPEEKPGSIMPNLDLSEDEITQLIAYLKTLK